MKKPLQDVTGQEPDLIECRTERIANNLSRCLANNSLCEHALAAGPTRTICMHKQRRDFEYAAFLTPPP
ncbi:MAG TPA: hypothetical protein VIH45_03765 [Desulfuromonadaceae bacterium]